MLQGGENETTRRHPASIDLGLGDTVQRAEIPESQAIHLPWPREHMPGGHFANSASALRDHLDTKVTDAHARLRDAGSPTAIVSLAMVQQWCQ